MSDEAPPESEDMRKLQEMLPEAWARTELGDELDTVASFVRAAYGAGYVSALET